MFPDKSTHPAPKLGDSWNQLGGCHLSGRLQPAGELGVQTPSCAESELLRIGKPSARNLAGDQTNSQDIRIGKDLRDQYIPVTFQMGKLRATDGRGLDGSTEPGTSDSLPWSPCGAATRYEKVSAGLDVRTAEGKGLPAGGMPRAEVWHCGDASWNPITTANVYSVPTLVGRCSKRVTLIGLFILAPMP